MNKIKVLIVDDSATVRKALSDALSADPQLQVVGLCSNGKLALQKLRHVEPDVITLDVDMPEMNGLDALREIRKTRPSVPVIMFSGATETGAAATLDALALGANDYVAKPSSLSQDRECRIKVQEELISKIKGLASAAQQRSASPASPIPKIPGSVDSLAAVAIGASTGGPNALTEILSVLPADFPVPIFITQHMPPVFTRLLAERLRNKSRLITEEAQEGMSVLPGHVYIAPGDFHMECVRDQESVYIRLNKDPHENSCRPAVDVMLRSIAKTFGGKVLTVILTGMGTDGLLGTQKLKSLGAQVIAQDVSTSVVWGMPGAIAQAGLADMVLPISKIPSEIIKRVLRPHPSHVCGSPPPPLTSDR